MFNKLLKIIFARAINDIKSDLGGVKSKLGNMEDNVKEVKKDIKDLEEKTFMTEEKKDDFYSSYIKFSWYPEPKPQSLEQKVKDLESQLESLKNHFKVSINFETSEGWRVRSLAPKVKKVSQKKK